MLAVEQRTHLTVQEAALLFLGNPLALLSHPSVDTLLLLTQASAEETAFSGHPFLSCHSVPTCSHLRHVQASSLQSGFPSAEFHRSRP